MNRISIQIWMMSQQPQITQAQIARDLGLGQSTVSMTLNGERAHIGVIDWLINHGCPAELLACDWPGKDDGNNPKSATVADFPEVKINKINGL